MLVRSLTCAAARDKTAAVKRLAALVLAITSVSACKRHTDPGPGAPCSAVGARFAMVARADLAASKDLTEELRHGVDGLIAPMRDGMVRACEEGAWGEPARDCFAAAADERAMKACYAQLSADQRAALDRAAAGAKSDETR
jgi:hypothetical protein